MLARFELDPGLVHSAMSYYADPANIAEFINHWVDTFDPRNARSKELSTNLPLVMFQRQADLVAFVAACMDDEEDGLVEKSRDMGASWVCCGISVWLWLFQPGSAVGWGSRKEEYVDKIGDPKAIFTKIRMILDRLPRQFLPRGLNARDHLTYMKIVNPENGATITGEAGDNIGRGGRTSIYFKDESAHYARPELIEASLGDNTRCQIDISSVNGIGNVFHRRRDTGQIWAPGVEMEPGRARVFVLDWHDHPMKTQAWYDRRQAKAAREGLSAKFSQEVDRDYAASQVGAIIKLEWVEAAVDAHLEIGFEPTGGLGSGLDVADGGADRNAQAVRRGQLLFALDEWTDRDVGVTTRRALFNLVGLGKVRLEYDSIGIGAGVKAEANRLKDENKLPAWISFSAWNAAASVVNPEGRVIEGDEESEFNQDFFANMKAQAWWSIARKFENTFRMINDPNFRCSVDELISLDSRMPLLPQLKKELCQVVQKPGANMKMVINKQPEGTVSPNLADAVVMTFYPAPDNSAPELRIGSY
jgi:phage terminase large subunit